MIRRPVDLPLLRHDLLERVAAYGPGLYAQTIKKGKQEPRPAGPPEEAGTVLAQRECQRVSMAELFYVNGDMLELAIVAERSLPEFSLMPEDLPSEFGFIVFAEPLEVVTSPGEHESAVVAASWGRWYDCPSQWPFGGIWITWYIDTYRWVDTMVSIGKCDLGEADSLRQRYGPLMIELESPQPFSPVALPVWDSRHQKSVQYKDVDDSFAIHWVGALKTIWLLMKQTIGHVETARFDRATLRRMSRQNIKPHEVRVITLRRQASGGDGQSDREYHHQWLVRGHWRQQWYPSRDVHRPIWIAPHIKGPEGAPLLGGEKVYALQR